MKAIDKQLFPTDRFAACIRDDRQPGEVTHGCLDLPRQRVFGIAAGYPDCNDADPWVHAPIQKLLLGRDPIDGPGLGFQPTLSCFENAPSSKELFRMAEALADVVIERHVRWLGGKARRITIDLDPTDDPTHGARQLSFFNGPCNTFFFLPRVGTVHFNDELEMHLFAVVLRPGNARCSRGAIGILMRVIARLRPAFPKARLRVRLEGGFATAEIVDCLELEPEKQQAWLVRQSLMDGFMRNA